MGRYNTSTATTYRKPVKSPVKTVTPARRARTHEGGVGYVNDTKGELFRLGVTLFAGEKTFYESGKARNARFSQLVGTVAVSDPEWVAGFLGWLRSEGNIRTASLLGAVVAVKARLEAGLTGQNRSLINSVCQRADEPAEILAIWAVEYGKPFPKPVKRGVADATSRLANEYSVMKYDTAAHTWRLADVLNLTHLTPKDAAQAALFNVAIAQRHGNPYSVDADLLPMLDANRRLRAEVVRNPKALLDPVRLKEAGMTWEDALSLAGNSIDKAKLWESLILGYSVGYMAMLRNLRNFEQAGISREAQNYVTDMLADPQRVAKSRQFPYRFWSAYKNTLGVTYASALEMALTASVSNLPEFPGRSLVLVDVSGSMDATISDKSQMTRAEAGAIFGAALALRNAGKVDLVQFGTTSAPVAVRKGASILRTVNDITTNHGVGHGTETVRAVQRHYAGHDRVLIFTDMQSFASSGNYWNGSYQGTIDSSVPADKFVYAWDLSGYKTGDIPSGVGKRHQLAGLSDASFKVIPLLERGSDAGWPWEL